MLQIRVQRYEEALLGSVADKRDFYRQFFTTDERCVTNAIFPPMPAEKLRGTKAFEEYMQSWGTAASLKGRRERQESLPKISCRDPFLVAAGEDVCRCFAALFQGDHLGVEYATDAHANLLMSHGLILQESRLQSDKPLVLDDVVSGLVIDDFFVLSKEPAKQSENYRDSRSLRGFTIESAFLVQMTRMSSLPPLSKLVGMKLFHPSRLSRVVWYSWPHL